MIRRLAALGIERRGLWTGSQTRAAPIMSLPKPVCANDHAAACTGKAVEGEQIVKSIYRSTARQYGRSHRGRHQVFEAIRPQLQLASDSDCRRQSDTSAGCWSCRTSYQSRRERG